MTTINTIHLSVDSPPQYYRPGITNDSTQLASSLLQENHDKHHIFFNADGFHNHIAHHLLSLWALKASPDDIKRAYDINKSYQRRLEAPRQDDVEQLRDSENFMSHVGPKAAYNDFLKLFEAEIEETSWQQVLQKYLFAGDQRAEDMLVRMFAGFLHPIIHLGFGVEFQQPGIIAEALAQAACHDSWIGKMLLPAEKAAKEQTPQTSKSIVALLDEIYADPEIQKATKWEDGNKIRDGLLVRAPDRLVDYMSQVHVKPEELEEKTAEMTNAVAYYTAGAQRKDKMVRYDFYFIHCFNASVFWSAFLKQDWLSPANKVRLLEWKIRMDLTMYASRKSPKILMDEIRGHKPKKPSGWDEVQDRVCSIDDDGHTVKLVRAIAHAQEISKPYEDNDAFRLKQADFLQLAHMAIDAAESTAGTSESGWVRSAGFDEAWEEVPAKL